MSDTDATDTEPDPAAFVELDVAAPRVLDARFFKTYSGTWYAVLDGEADIEADEITVMAGEPATETFQGWEHLHYSDTVTAIFPADHEFVGEHRAEDDTEVRPADDTVATLQER